MPVVYQFGRMPSQNVGSLRSPENDVLLQVLRDARTAARISQEDLSIRLGQSITFMVKIERGTRRLDVVEFIRIARELDIAPDELLRTVLEKL